MTIATIEAKKTKRTPVPLNGVDTPTLISTINAVGAKPELAKFTFRNSNEWISGTHSRSTMKGFYGAGGEHAHKASYSAESDHPAVLCGADNAPTPVEWLLHALAACLTAGIGNIAAARGVKLTRVKSTVEGNIDLRGILGLSDEVRNGYQGVTARCAARNAQGDRRAIARTIGRIRCAHARCAGFRGGSRVNALARERSDH